MDHQWAVDRRFPERYLLDELSPEEAADFEAHFFECPLCADEVRAGAQLAANLKAVLREAVHEETVRPRADSRIEIHSTDRFLDLTIALEPSESSPHIACEFHFAEASAPIVMAVIMRDDLIRLRLPADRFPAGACTMVLRDEDSRRELGQRRLLITKQY